MTEKEGGREEEERISSVCLEVQYYRQRTRSRFSTMDRSTRRVSAPRTEQETYFPHWPLRDAELPGGSAIRNPPALQETRVRSLGREDPLEKEMATYSSVLAWRVPWTEEPGGLQSLGLQNQR